MKGIRHIFFDLDHTLWDYDKNARETLEEIHNTLDADVPLQKFVKTFYKVNEGLWHKYNRGVIDRAFIKENRFREIFEVVGVNAAKADESSDYFMNNCSTKPHLITYAKSALDYLSKKYQLHIVTNGFEDVQPRKLRSSGIDHYFEVIVTSETSNARKPSPEIFRYALDEARANKGESVMIGDNPKTDIHGARDFGIRTILFDPSGKKRSMADYSIQSLHELIGIL